MWKVQYITGEEIEYQTLLEAYKDMHKRCIAGIIYDDAGRARVLVTGFSYTIPVEEDCPEAS